MESETNNLKVTPASDFRKVREQGVLVPLYSGRVVRMRTTDPERLLRLGKIPDPLAEICMGLIYGNLTNEVYQKMFDITERKEHALDMMDSFEIVCTDVLVEPRVVAEPQADDEITITDLEISERRQIFDLALLEATRLATFLETQASGMGSVYAGGELAPATEPGSEG